MYAALADLLDQVAESDLVALTDDEQTGEVNTDVVDRMIEKGDALIDAHCGDRYKIPFDQVQELALMYYVDLETIATRQKQALAYLQSVQAGKGSMGVQPNATSGTESHSALVGGNARIFTRDKMRGL